MKKKGSWASTNARRVKEIDYYEGKLHFVRKLIYNDDFDWELEELLAA